MSGTVAFVCATALATAFAAEFALLIFGFFFVDACAFIPDGAVREEHRAPTFGGRFNGMVFVATEVGLGAVNSSGFSDSLSLLLSLVESTVL